MAYGFYGELSSSYLKNPIKPKPPEEIQVKTEEKVKEYIPGPPSVEEEEAEAIKEGLETCKFTIMSLTDGDNNTAWCEGVEGDGVGEVALVLLNPKKYLRIFNGYQKSDATYNNNHRVKKIAVHVFETGPFSLFFSSSEANPMSQMSRVWHHEYELKDVQDIQELELKELPEVAEGKQHIVGIEILATYPGKKYQDTCLSEINTK